MEPKPWPYTQELVLSFWPCSNWEQSAYTLDRMSTRLNYTSGQEALIWPKIKNSFVVVSKEELGGTANCRYTIISRNREVVLCSTGVLRNSLIIWSCLLFLKKNCISNPVNSCHYLADKNTLQAGSSLIDLLHYFPFHELSISYIIKEAFKGQSVKL